MKRTAVFRCGALLYFAEQNEGGQNPIHSYTNCALVNDLVMLLYSTELTYQMYLGISHGVTFNLIPNFMESCYGQISIETATYSYKFCLSTLWLFHKFKVIGKEYLQFCSLFWLDGEVELYWHVTPPSWISSECNTPSENAGWFYLDGII